LFFADAFLCVRVGLCRAAFGGRTKGDCGWKEWIVWFRSPVSSEDVSDAVITPTASPYIGEQRWRWVIF
jgi:hypothetical protein